MASSRSTSAGRSSNRFSRTASRSSPSSAATSSHREAISARSSSNSPLRHRRRHLFQDAGGAVVVEGVEALPGPLQGLIGDNPPPLALGRKLADELAGPLGPLGQAGMIILGKGRQQGNRLVEAAGRPHLGYGAEIVARALELFGGGVGQIRRRRPRRSSRPPRTPGRSGSTVPTTAPRTSRKTSAAARWPPRTAGKIVPPRARSRSLRLSTLVIRFVLLTLRVRKRHRSPHAPREEAASCGA